MMNNIFTIIFTQGVDYIAKDITQLHQYQKTIYNNFCLLSWLISNYKIRVIDQIILDQLCKIKIFKRGKLDQNYYILQRKKDNFIYYSIDLYGNATTQAFIKRAIQTAKKDEGIQAQFQNSVKLDSFRITICCKTNVSVGLSFEQVFKNQIIPKQNEKDKDRHEKYNYFSPPCKKSNQLKGSQFDIEYYYIQPQKQRHFQPQGYHLNLAFQGGGAKGVSYVGVKNAINKLQQRIRQQSQNSIQLPVRSVIGSSAGGILALAITAGLQHQDLIQICYMMDTLVQDKLIKNQDLSQSSLNPINQKYSQDIKSQFFSQQQIAIKNMFHNLGLVQQNLSDIIFETLKQPSVQQKLFALFSQLNPSIAELLSFKQPYERGTGQTINNCCGACLCCCCYKDCCGCYPCCKAIPCSSCFVTSSNQYRKINIYGLLYAALMTGEAVENIIAYALSLFLEIEARKKSERLYRLARRKWFTNNQSSQYIFQEILRNAFILRKTYKQKQNHLDQHYLQNILIKFSKELTLKEFYYLNSVQFTCTSVDLNDKIQRFLNHKTTPNLPVCKAVQMTGSFPAAFISLQWKKQWGKYYIHYNRTRREIDLTGHNFTDGGLLANFPLKFLDNQKFRPKYFSHKSVTGTFLYGFGLEQMQDFAQNDQSQKIKECLSSFTSEFKYRIMYRLAACLMKCGSKQTLQIKKIKLFQFLLSLVQALRQSDRNLNKQCFKYQIIQTIMSKKSIQSKQDLKIIKLPLTNFINSLDSTIRAHFFKNRQEMLNDQFNSIYEGFSKFDQACRQGNRNIFQIFNRKLEWAQLQSIQRRIQNNILIYSKKCIEIYQRKRQQLNNKYESTDLFMTSSTLHHQYEILGLLYQLKDCLMNLPQNQFHYIKENMYKNCNQYYTKIRSIYEQVLEGLEEDRNPLKQKQVLINQKQVLGLLNIKYKLSPYILAMFNKIQQVSEFQHSSPIINLYVEENTYLNKNKIQGMIKKEIQEKKQSFELLNKNKRTRLHIIFQAQYFSHYYFTNYIKMVEQVIADDKNIKIDIISCTNYHAIFGVFYLLGYEANTIKRRMYQIQYLFEENQNIDEIYGSKQWMKTSIEQMKTLLKRQWIKQIDPFELIQQQRQRGNLTEKLQIHDDVCNHIETDQQYINSAFEKVIQYISSSFKQVSQLSKQQRKDRFDELLSLGKYKTINQFKSKVGQRIVTIFLKYTINLMMITAQHIFKNQQFALFSSKKWSKETIFKGMVVSSLINAFKYRIYIYDILNRAGLDRNITLSKFYQACQRKIILNFNATNTTQKRFSLINKVTKPNMPLWAALIASASLPYLEGQFDSHREWQNKQKGDIKIEMADMFFRQFQGKNIKGQNSYISSNAIATLPIQLMTNHRLIDSKLSEEKQETNTIEIVFAFDSQFNKSSFQVNPEEQYQNQNAQSGLNKQAQLTTFFNQLPKQMQGKRKFFTGFDIIRYLFEGIFHDLSLLGLNYFKDILNQIGTLKMLDIKMNAHDSLILNLYYDSLIKLPIRIGTLDFYKINKNRLDLQDAIIQSQEVVREICDTIAINPYSKTKLSPKIPSRTTIQVSNHRCDIYNKERKLWESQKQFYRIKFISYTRWRDFKYKYFIEYSNDIKNNNFRMIDWIKVKEDYVDVNKSMFVNNQYQILIRYTYYQNHLVSRIYMVSMKALKNLQLENARAIFTLNYRQIYSAQQPIHFNQYQITPITDKILVKSYFIPRNSKYCSNFECSAQKLEYVLTREEYLACYTCSGQHFISGRSCQSTQFSQVSLIAMRCPRCNKNYCLKCKLHNFIRKQIKPYDSFEYKCPKNQGEQGAEILFETSEAPIKYRYIGEGIASIKNNCLYCEKYSNKLMHQTGITSGNFNKNMFSGLRICEICTLYHVK